MATMACLDRRDGHRIDGRRGEQKDKHRQTNQAGTAGSRSSGGQRLVTDRDYCVVVGSVEGGMSRCEQGNRSR
jgi:hypothetical protein